jgi:tetratricopeptide (TPR) repeat protein
MRVAHPVGDDFSRFVKGELSAGENQWIVRHLLADCCRRELDDLWQTASPMAEDLEQQLTGPNRESDYSRAFESSLDPLEEHARALSVEQARAPELLARLAAVPQEERKAAIRRDAELRSWALCELLIEECHQLAYSEAARAGEISNLAVSVAEELDAGRYGEPLVNDLKARAWACAGEVLRVLSHLRQAEEAFAKAESAIGEGTGDALEEARILELKAALRSDQRRTVEAHGLIEEVIAVYRQYKDLHLLGRAFVRKGRIYGATQDWAAAIRWLRKGLALLDPLRERQLELSVRHSLIWFLHEGGRQQEAWFMLEASRQELGDFGGSLLGLRLRWLEGRIQTALHRLDAAEPALVEARGGFIEAGIGFDAALVSLDLAGLYASQGRAAEMRRLAEEMIPVFQSRDVHREAIAALMVFQQALRMEQLNSTLLREIRTYLSQARKDHSLRFEHQA